MWRKLGKSAQVVKKCFDYENDFERLGERLGSYAFLKQSQDVTDAHSQGMVQQFSFVATHAGEADAGFDSRVAIFSLTKAGLMFEASAGASKYKFKPAK